MFISEYVSKIESEFSSREEALRSKEAELVRKEDELRAKQTEIARQLLELSATLKEVQGREAKVSSIEAKLKRQEDIDADLLKAEIYRADAIKYRKEAEEKLGDARTALAELSKRELALAKEKSEYQEKMKKEYIDGFFEKISKLGK